MADDEMKAWDVRVAEALKIGRSESIDDARNLIIEEWLTEAGDARPFYDWVLSAAHVPSLCVVKLLAMMLAKADSPGFCPAGDATLRYMLEVRGDRAGRRTDMEAATRDFIAGREINSLMAAGWTQLAAEKCVDDWLKSEGVSVSPSTVEQARKKARRGRGKK